MIGDMFGNPDGVNLHAIPSFHPELGHWVVQFTLNGTKAFWQVDFLEQTSEEVDFDTRWEMRKTAIDMFQDTLLERLMT